MRSVYTDELDALVVHDVRNLIVGLDASLYDGMQSIKHADLSLFFKIMNLIIANNIDPCQHETKIVMDRIKFMIRVTPGIHIDLVELYF